MQLYLPEEFLDTAAHNAKVCLTSEHGMRFTSSSRPISKYRPIITTHDAINQEISGLLKNIFLLLMLIKSNIKCISLLLGPIAKPERRFGLLLRLIF
jgi:hypothetical protein